MNFIPKQGPKSFVAIMDLIFRRDLSIRFYFCRASYGFAGKGIEQVKHVSAKYPKILSATPMILLAATFHRMDMPQEAGVNELPCHRKGRMVAVAVSDR